MMKLVLVFVMLAGGACTATWGGEHRTLIMTANATTATVASVGMALDWCGTRHAAETRTDAWEGGMPTAHIIGTSPSAHVVDAYFAVGTVVLAAAAQLVPERYRWIAYGTIAAGELVTVHGNLSTTRCGPLGSH
jgi:hypothetical protein